MRIAFVVALLLAAPAVAATAGEPSVASAPAGSQDAPADFPSAVAAYRAGDYDAALAQFGALAAAEPDRARAAILHADAGPAAARANRLGEAVWHLRTAQALLPHDAVIATNLDRVRVLLGEGETEASQFTAMLRGLPLRSTRHESALAASLAVTVALLVLALRRAGRLGTGGLAFALVLLLGAGAWWWASTVAWNRLARQAVVIDDPVVGRAEPDELSEILFRLPGGSIVRCDEERHEWRLVESDAGARGWMPAAQVRPLGLRP